MQNYYEYCLSFWGGNAVFWSTFIIIVLLLKETCGFKNSVKWHVLFAIYRRFLHAPLLMMATEGVYADALWPKLLYLISFLGGCVVCYYYMLHHVYQGKLPKIFLFAFFGEFIAVVIHSTIFMLFFYAANALHMPIIDSLMAVCVMLVTLAVFLGMLHILRPLLERVKKQEMNNILTWANAAFGTGYCIVDNSQAVLAKSYNSYIIDISDKTMSQVGYFYAVLFFVFVAALFCFLRKRLQLLQATKDRMRNWYDDIMHNGVQVENIETDMTSALKEVMSKTSAKGRKESLQNYCTKLQASYEKMKGNLYCRDYMVDATLADCVKKCQERNIDTQIHFQTYDRGELNELTICYIVTQCFEAVMETANGIKKEAANANVCFMAMNAKGMSVFEMAYTQGDGQKIEKRPFRQLERQLESTVLKKNGFIKVKHHKDRVEVMISIS